MAPGAPQHSMPRRNNAFECGRVLWIKLLTVNCGPAMKGSGNEVTGSTGNVFIFKKERKQVLLSD